MTHNENLHIAPLLLTRSTDVKPGAIKLVRQLPGGRALCLIHPLNETLCFTSMA
ncbi:hypothetical protein HMPREF0880_04571 [Yokenella regensburgei ATCC 43003]|nr:hypothetical protein HMPREF0880_04571 [Yokenella regensburgei ATCC 43003]